MVDEVREFPEMPEPVVARRRWSSFALPVCTFFLFAAAVCFYVICISRMRISILPQQPVACTMEALICPDGSAVGRSGPNCEFSPCPTPTPTPTSFGFPFVAPSGYVAQPLPLIDGTAVFGLFPSSAQARECFDHVQATGTFYESKQSQAAFPPCSDHETEIMIVEMTQAEFSQRMLVPQQYQAKNGIDWTWQVLEVQGHWRVQAWSGNNNGGWYVQFDSLVTNFTDEKLFSRFVFSVLDTFTPAMLTSTGPDTLL